MDRQAEHDGRMLRLKHERAEAEGMEMADAS
jgi:hypothetical protein